MHTSECQYALEAERNIQYERKRMSQLDKIGDVLATRKSSYGDYADNARVTQAVMDILMTGANSGAMNAMHKEGIHMIVHKLSRIVNGDPDFHDSWDDIGGYARCVSERIPNKKGQA